MASLRLEVPCEGRALYRMRHRVGEWLREHEIEGEALFAVLIAVNEAATNVIEHTESQESFEVIVSVSGGVEVIVKDRGRWQPEDYSDDERGRGLILMRALATSLAIEPDEDGTTIRLRFDLAPPPGEAEPTAHPSADAPAAPGRPAPGP